MSATRFNEFDTIYAPPDTAIDDKGGEHDTIQNAVDNADNWVLVGPGTFAEAVDITKDDFMLMGSGPATFIDATGTGSNAVDFESDGGTIRDLRVENDEPGISAISAIPSVDGEEKNRIAGITVEDSGSAGITFDTRNSILSNVIVKSAGTYGINVGGSGCAVVNCTLGVTGTGGMRVRTRTNVISNINILQGATGDKGLVLDATELFASNIAVRNVNDNGIEVNGDDVVLNGFGVDGAGGDGLLVTGTDDVISNGVIVASTGADVNDGAATTPHYSNVIAGGVQQDNIAATSVTDDTWVQRLVDSPNGTIMNAVLDDGDSAEITIPVADQETLKVYRWGAYQISDGTTPANLDMELLDGSDVVQVTENTGDSESTDPATPVASHQNTSGSVSIFKIAAANDTGGTIADPGVGAFAAYLVE